LSVSIAYNAVTVFQS